MKTLSALEIIEETVRYYSKNPVKRRAVIISAQDPISTECLYKTDDSKKCAVGRMGNKNFNFDHRGNICDYIESQWILNKNFKISDHLFPRYQNCSQKFLTDLQDLHDDEDFWNDKGLTKLGSNKLDELKEKYATQ